VNYIDHNVDRHPIGGAEAMQIVRRFHTLYAKIGGKIVRWDQGGSAIPEADLRHAFVHEDGQLRIPVLAVGGVIVRGFDEPTYRTVLTSHGIQHAPLC
jgi:hypothetical protein